MHTVSGSFKTDSLTTSEMVALLVWVMLCHFLPWRAKFFFFCTEWTKLRSQRKKNNITVLSCAHKPAVIAWVSVFLMSDNCSCVQGCVLWLEKNMHLCLPWASAVIFFFPRLIRPDLGWVSPPNPHVPAWLCQTVLVYLERWTCFRGLLGALPLPIVLVREGGAVWLAFFGRWLTGFGKGEWTCHVTSWVTVQFPTMGSVTEIGTAPLLKSQRSHEGWSASGSESRPPYHERVRSVDVMRVLLHKVSSFGLVLKGAVGWGTWLRCLLSLKA